MYDTWLTSSPAPWLAHANFLISAILVIPAIGNFLYTIARERGEDARVVRIIKDGKKRIDVVAAALSIRERILEGDRLAEAKAEALDRIGEIEKGMKNDLAANATKNFSVPVIGVPAWRVALGLYKPVTHDRTKSIVFRVVFLYSVFALFVVIPLVLGWGYLRAIPIIWYWQLHHRPSLMSSRPFLAFVLAIDVLNICLYRYSISKESGLIVSKLRR